MSRLRVAWLVLVTAWLLLIPVFSTNASHFGWGFFPMMATVFFVPIATIVLAGDFLANAFMMFSNPETRKRRGMLAGISLALLLPYLYLVVAFQR